MDERAVGRQMVGALKSSNMKDYEPPSAEKRLKIIT
jgi:hypothetical protein